MCRDETLKKSWVHFLFGHRLEQNYCNSTPTFLSHQVKFSVFLQYLRASGWVFTTTFITIYFLQNIAFIGQNIWLSDWTNDALKYPNGSSYPGHVRDMRIGVFGALGVAQGTVFTRSSEMLHENEMCVLGMLGNTNALFTTNIYAGTNRIRSIFPPPLHSSLVSACSGLLWFVI